MPLPAKNYSFSSNSLHVDIKLNFMQQCIIASLIYFQPSPGASETKWREMEWNIINDADVPHLSSMDACCRPAGRFCHHHNRISCDAFFVTAIRYPHWCEWSEVMWRAIQCHKVSDISRYVTCNGCCEMAPDRSSMQWWSNRVELSAVYQIIDAPLLLINHIYNVIWQASQ